MGIKFTYGVSKCMYRRLLERPYPAVVASLYLQIVGLLSLPKRDSNKLLSTRASTMSNVSSSYFENISLGLDSPESAYHKRSSTSTNASFTGRRLSFLCSKFAMDKAAQGGHLEVLQLLHDQVLDVCV